MSASGHPVLELLDLSGAECSDDRRNVNGLNDDAQSVSDEGLDGAPHKGGAQFQARAEVVDDGDDSLRRKNDREDSLRKKMRRVREAASLQLDRLVYDSWVFEILSMMFSLACLLTVVSVLLIYQDKPDHPMPYGITLNAIVSVLSTASRVSLVCVLAGCMSQLKWGLFIKERRLYDLQLIDNATRGPLGSIMLLFEKSSSIVIYVGATAIVLALIYDPMMQQIIRYPTRTRPSTNDIASTRAATGHKDVFVIPDWEIERAVNLGFWSHSVDFRWSPICPSGTCKWPSFESVEWCSKCTDARPLVRLSNGCTSNLTLPGSGSCDLTLDSGIPTRLAEWNTTSEDFRLHVAKERLWTSYKRSTPGAITALFQGPRDNIIRDHGPISTIGFVSTKVNIVSEHGVSSRLDVEVLRAEQCILTPCVQHKSIEITRDVPKIRTKSTDYGSTRWIFYDPDHYYGMYVSSLCWMPDHNSTYPDLPTKCGNACLELLRNSYRSSTCNLMRVRWLLEKRLDATRFDTLANTFSSYEQSNLIEVVAANNLSYVMGNIATSLTQLFFDLYNQTVTGTTYVSETYVKVRWEWLALPLVLEAVAVMFLAATILLTRRDKLPLWRSSMLPLSYCCIQDEPVEHHLEGSNISDMNTKAKVTTATIFSTQGTTKLKTMQSMQGSSQSLI